MYESDLEKAKIREKYKGISSDRILVIPAIEQVSFYEDFSDKNVAVYVRVSTDHLQQTSSFELQQNHYQDVVGRHPGWKLHQIYPDEGISGTSLTHRTAFLQMVKDCEDGKIDLILTKSVNRFARNVYDCIGYVRMLAALKKPVGVFFETENLYSLNKDSEMSLTFLATLAQEESRSKSNSMNLSYDMRFHRGILLTPELLGYDLDENGQLVINEEEALTIRLIYFMYLYGYTCRQIADTLMRLRRTTKRDNYRWSDGTVLAILQNERHCGDVCARKTWTPNYLDHKSKKNQFNRNQYYFEDHHDAIITRDDFLAVQRLIRNAKYGYRGPLPALRVIDSGLLKGFVSINPRWSGFRQQDYIEAANSVVTESSTAESVVSVSEGEFDLRGYEIARGEFFRSLRDLAITFSRNEIIFSSACLPKLNHNLWVELLIHPLHHLLAVRPAKKENRNSVSWLGHDGKVYHPKVIHGNAFLGAIFQLLGWEDTNKYRICGVRRQQDEDTLLWFDLRDTEVTLLAKPSTHEPDCNQPHITENQRPLTMSTQKKVIAYPVDWFEDFGTEYYRHAQIQELLSINVAGGWNTQHPGIIASYAEGLSPTTPEQLEQGLNDLFITMQEVEQKDEPSEL